MWVGCAALVCVAYFALLVYAMFTDGGLGGPLALPFFVVVAALFGMAVSVCVCLPATAFAELVRRWRRWRLVWEVPLFGFPLGAFVVLLACLNREWADVPQPDTLWAVIAGSLFVLLLFYWCALQLVELAYWLLGRAWRAFTWRLGD